MGRATLPFSLPTFASDCCSCCSCGDVRQSNTATPHLLCWVACLACWPWWRAAHSRLCHTFRHSPAWSQQRPPYVLINTVHVARCLTPGVEICIALWQDAHACTWKGRVAPLSCVALCCVGGRELHARCWSKHGLHRCSRYCLHAPRIIFRSNFSVVQDAAFIFR